MTKTKVKKIKTEKVVPKHISVQDHAMDMENVYHWIREIQESVEEIRSKLDRVADRMGM